MTDVEKFNDIISEIDFLIAHSVTSKTPAFCAWKTSAERFLIKKFGENSFEYQDFLKLSFRPSAWTSDHALVQGCKDGLVTAKMVFESYLRELQESTDEDLFENGENDDFSKVFIVHGHDGELKQSVARLVEKQDLEAIMLSEQANKGKTIIEKFEENSDVSGAICLFTADDFGRAKAAAEDQPRARQNVVFEAGYFMGKLSRSRVVIIAEHGVELPSDMQGIVYTDKSNWEVDVLKELKAMGYTIDFNKLFS